MSLRNTNYRQCSKCQQVKDNKEFVAVGRGGLKIDSVNKRMCYKCESDMWNPIITRRLVS